MPLVWLVWTVFRYSGKNADALALCRALVNLLTEALEQSLAGVLRENFPACRSIMEKRLRTCRTMPAMTKAGG